jgi:hypothetical protein
MAQDHDFKSDRTTLGGDEKFSVSIDKHLVCRKILLRESTMHIIATNL